MTLFELWFRPKIRCSSSKFLNQSPKAWTYGHQRGRWEKHSMCRSRLESPASWIGPGLTWSLPGIFSMVNLYPGDGDGIIRGLIRAACFHCDDNHDDTSGDSVFAGYSPFIQPSSSHSMRSFLKLGTTKSGFIFSTFVHYQHDINHDFGWFETIIWDPIFLNQNLTDFWMVKSIFGNYYINNPFRDTHHFRTEPWTILLRRTQVATAVSRNSARAGGPPRVKPASPGDRVTGP